MIAVGNENNKIKHKYRCKYCHHMPMLPLLGANHLLPLFHMVKRCIWLEERKSVLMSLRLDILLIQVLHFDKPFRDQVQKYMNTTFDALTKSFIKATLSKKNRSVLALIFFMRQEDESLRKLSEC